MFNEQPIVFRSSIKSKIDNIIDTVRSHLLSQNKKSFGEKEEKCLYRGPNGLKCALGVLIPDDKYHVSMESPSEQGWHSIMYIIASRFGILVVSEGYTAFDRLMSKMQTIHDRHNVEEWADQLNELQASIVFVSKEPQTPTKSEDKYDRY